MANPNKAIGTNGAYFGRTSVNAFNDVLALLSRGVLSGWECSASSGMDVTIGGVSGIRDVAIAEDNNGNRTTVNNISEAPITVTIDTAPASNSRIDSIVLYVDNPPSELMVISDNPDTCGVVVVKGTAGVNPQPPTDAMIRTAITTQAANGTIAYYAVVANITVAAGTTVITQNLIQTTNMFDFQKLTFTSKDISTTETTLTSYEAKTAGTYLISANVCFMRNGGGASDLLLGANKGGTVLGVVGAHTEPDNRRTPVSGTWVVKLDIGDTVSVTGITTNGLIWANNNYSTIYATRIK